MAHIRHGQHFTRNTQAATFWCNKCKKFTLHKISDRRRGPCLVCYPELDTTKPVPIPGMKPETSFVSIACTCSMYDFPHHHRDMSRIWR